MRRLACLLALTACDPELAREVVPTPATQAPTDYPDVTRVQLTPKPVDFGRVAVGGTRAVEVVLENRWDAPVRVLDATLLPAGEAARLPRRLHDDIRDGLTLAPGASYAFEVSFQPEAPTRYEGRLELRLPSGAVKAAEVTGVAPGDTGLP